MIGLKEHVVLTSVPRRPTEDSLETLIAEIHGKLNGSVFNGGFERLAQSVERLTGKVETIEGQQQEMLGKLGQIHDVIYEPDDGLFARVKKVENIHNNEFEPLRKDISEINAWKESLTSKDGALTLAAADHAEIAQISAWKKRILGFFLAVSGSTLLMVAKTVWSFVSDHITLH